LPTEYPCSFVRQTIAFRRLSTALTRTRRSPRPHTLPFPSPCGTGHRFSWPVQSTKSPLVAVRSTGFSLSCDTAFRPSLEISPKSPEGASSSFRVTGRTTSRPSPDSFCSEDICGPGWQQALRRLDTQQALRRLDMQRALRRLDTQQALRRLDTLTKHSWRGRSCLPRLDSSSRLQSWGPQEPSLQGQPQAVGLTTGRRQPPSPNSCSFVSIRGPLQGVPRP
jgi:hypothetical protein